MPKKTAPKTTPKRFAVKKKDSYGETLYRIVDTQKNDSDVMEPDTDRKRAELVVAALNNDPKVVPGARVRFAADTHDLGASERDELHRITNDRYGAGDEGVLAFPHPNQIRCVNWWFVEVDSKTGERRKLYVCVPVRELELKDLGGEPMGRKKSLFNPKGEYLCRLKGEDPALGFSYAAVDMTARSAAELFARTLYRLDKVAIGDGDIEVVVTTPFGEEMMYKVEIKLEPTFKLERVR